jgi:hypothetical protein
MIQRPVVTSLILCEQVVVEETTRNVTLVNCFHRKAVDGFPSDPFPFVVFAWLTDGMGESAIRLSISSLDTEEELHRSEGTYRFVNPLQTVRFSVRVPRLSFPTAGEYQVLLLAGEEMIAERKFTIFQKEAES